MVGIEAEVLHFIPGDLCFVSLLEVSPNCGIELVSPLVLAWSPDVVSSRTQVHDRVAVWCAQ